MGFFSLLELSVQPTYNTVSSPEHPNEIQPNLAQTAYE